jgi:hypothetical protein
MTFQLTEEQRQALEAQPNLPVRLVDAHTKAVYVLLPGELYERMKAAMDQDPLRDTYPAQMEAAMRAGWDDPAMDDYNRYDEHRGRP